MNNNMSVSTGTGGGAAAQLTAQNTRRQKLVAKVESEMENITHMAGGSNLARAVVTQVLLDINKDPKKLACSSVSIMECVFKAASLGLLPAVRNQISFVPFQNRQTGVSTLTPIIGYQGMISLINRGSAQIAIHVSEIRENDTYDIVEGSEPKLTHKPLLTGERGNIIIFYAVASFNNAQNTFVWASIAQMRAHKNKYASSKNTFWSEDAKTGNFNEMCKKTMILRLCKGINISPEINDVISHEHNMLEEQNNVEQAVQPVEQQRGESSPNNSQHDHDQPQQARDDFSEI